MKDALGSVPIKFYDPSEHPTMTIISPDNIGFVGRLWRVIKMPWNIIEYLFTGKLEVL